MYRLGVHRIAGRIIRLHKPWVRPIKRGKLGNWIRVPNPSIPALPSGPLNTTRLLSARNRPPIIGKRLQLDLIVVQLRFISRSITDQPISGSSGTNAADSAKIVEYSMVTFVWSSSRSNVSGQPIRQNLRDNSPSVRVHIPFQCSTPSATLIRTVSSSVPVALSVPHIYSPCPSSKNTSTPSVSSNLSPSGTQVESSTTYGFPSRVHSPEIAPQDKGRVGERGKRKEESRKLKSDHQMDFRRRRNEEVLPPAFASAPAKTQNARP